MMLARRWLGVTMVLLALLVMTATGSAQTYTLRLANYFPAPADQSKLLDRFVEDLQRLSDGRLVIEHYPGGTLLGAPEIYDGVTQGIADIGFSNLGYTFGRFMETELLDLPLGFPNAWAANKVVQEFYDRYQPAEWNDTKVLAIHSSPVNNIFTVDRPVRRIEDLRGLTLRGTGYIARFVEALGATSRAVAMPEAYDNLSKRVIDGLLVPYETAVTFRFGEVTHYITEVWPMGQVYTFYFVMNKNTWNRLPADLQNVIEDYMANEFRDLLTEMWNDIDVMGYEYAVSAGYEFVQLDDAELARWQAVADEVIESYISDMSRRGHNADDLRERIAFVRERIAYWLEQQEALGVKSSTGPDAVRLY